jgi:hypothetical protein
MEHELDGNDSKTSPKNGALSYRVMSSQSDGFPPKEEAKHWAKLEEARRR